MTPKAKTTSKRARDGAGTSRARQYNEVKFLGPDQQDRYEALKNRKFLAEKPFMFNPHGKYRAFAQIINERGWGRLVDPVSRVNYDAVREFYANALPREGEPFRYESFVRGKTVSFDRDAVNEILGHPSNLETEVLDEFTQKLGTHRDFDHMARILLQNGRSVHLNSVGVPMRYAREDMTTKAQVFLLLVLYNIKPKSHRTTAPIDMAFLVACILDGTEIDVARIIANEMRLALKNCKHSGGKAPAPLIFPSLITSLCLKAGVQFHTSQAVVNPGTIDDEYVEMFCLPKSKKRTAEDTSAPDAEVGGPSGGSFDDYDPRQMEICNYNWDMMEAQQSLHSDACLDGESAVAVS